MPEAKIFIGSSKESLAVVDALEEVLRNKTVTTKSGEQLEIKVERWDQDLFRPGRLTLPQLQSEAEAVDFAVFVLGQDDRTESRGAPQPSPRDNVVFEAGLFTALLGTERTFYIVDQAGTKIPSDWDGLGYLTYDRKQARARDIVFTAVKQILERIAEGQPNAKNPTPLVTGRWWQYVINRDQGSVVSLFNISSSAEGEIRLEGMAWSTEGRQVARWRSRAAQLDRNTAVLFYYWEGEHPKEAEPDQYHGIGEIHFNELRPGLSQAQGFYTTVVNNQPGTLRRSCEYRRAQPDDLKTMETGSLEQRQKLIQLRLDERGNIDI